MKLEVGMYVRTKDGEIIKIKKIEDIYTSLNEFIGTVVYFGDSFHINIEEIKKASHNIIDLIEVGDYVNGYRVDYIENINANNNFILQRIFCEEYEKDLYSKSFKPSDIKSIVTSQQFENISYKIGD